MERLALLFLVSAIVSLHAQGTLGWQNNTSTRITNGVTGERLPVGNPAPFAAGVYWGPIGSSEGSLELLTATRTWGPFPGIYLGGTATFPVPGNTVVAVQIRVWSGDYGTYEDAVATGNPAVLAGKGILQQITLGGAGTPPSPPQSLVSPSGPGDTPFQAFGVFPVPEPGITALTLMGVAALLIRGRRREK